MKKVFDSDILKSLNDLWEKGIYVWEENGILKYKCKKELISKELVEELRANKLEIIDFFKRTEKNKFPLSPLQSAYLIGEETDCELGNTNAHYYIEYESSYIEIKRLEMAINTLIDKHDALRMVVSKDKSNMILDKLPRYRVPVYSYTNFEMRQKVRETWENYNYNPHLWPMFHLEVGRAKEGNDVLHISFDCLILDAWSAKKLIDEIFELYSGQVLEFPQLTFKSYMKQLKNYDYKLKDQAESYWMEKIKSMVLDPLNTRIPITDVVRPKFARIEYTFSLEETKQFYEVIKRYRLTPAATICLFFMKTICEKFQLQRLILDVTLFNRIPLSKDIDKVIGEFTNVGLVTYCSMESVSVLQDAKKVQNQFWRLVQFREYDGTKLIKRLGKGSVGKAILPIVYTCMLDGTCAVKKSKFHEVYALSKTPQVMLDHHVRDDLGSLKLSFDYVKDLFLYEDMQEMMKVYVQKIQNVINSPDLEHCNI